MTAALGGYIAAVWLDLAHSGRRDMSLPELVATGMAVAVTAALGGAVLRVRPGHRVGQILVGMSLCGTVTTFLEVYAFVGLVNPGHRLPFDRAADVASSGSWVTAYAALSVLVLFFPNGRLPSPGWRWPAWAMSGAFLAAWLLATLQPGRQDEPFESMSNPAGQSWLNGPGQILVAVAMVSMLAALAAAAASVADRYAASSGLERLQLKWLAYSVGLAPLALAGCYLGNRLLRSDVAAVVGLQLSLVLIPGSVGVAVLRYRLYEIDRLINRTAVYGLLTVGLAAIYAGVSLGGGLMAGRGSTLPTAAATLLTVVSFRPIRARAQDLVDRQFSPTRYRGRRLVAAYAADVRNDRADPAGIEPVLARALDMPSVRLALWVPSHQVYVSPAGLPVELNDADASGGLRVDLGGVHHALIMLPEGTVLSPDLAAAVLGEARLALQVAALRAEVVLQSAEAAQARVRVVEATFEERRRIERDLHDGAQQRLVYLGISLRRLQGSLPYEARILEPALNQAVAHVSEALADLRDLARGARPSRLTRGLRPALSDLAATTPLPVRLQLCPDDAPPEIEAVAYYVACEAVTNAVRHAQASEVILATTVGPAGFRLSVRDDGIGGADFSAGRGLSGLRSRAERHRGSLEVSSPEGRGTLVTVTLPCE